MLKKVSTFLLVLVTLLSLTACGKGDASADNDTKKPVGITDTAFTGAYESILFDELNTKIYSEKHNILDVIQHDGKVYILTEQYTDNGQDIKCLISSISGEYLDSKDISTSYIEINGTTYSSYGYKLLGNGNVTYIVNETTSDKISNKLTIYNVYDDTKSDIDITEHVPGYTYVNSISEDDSGNTILACTDKLLILPKESDSIKVLTIDSTLNLTNPINYNGKNPQFLYWDAESAKNKILEIDATTGDVVKRYDMIVDVSKYSFVKTSHIKWLVVSNEDSLQVINLDSGMSKLMDYMNSSVYAYRFKSLALMEDGSFIGEYVEDLNYISKIALFKPIKYGSEDATKKVVLTAIKATPELKKGIVDYNSSQNEYRIVLMNCDGDFTKFSEIIETDKTDLIFVDNSASIDRLAVENNFDDLNDFIKKDKSFNKKRYMTNFFDAYEINDNLYQIPTKVVVSTLLGKQSVFSEYKDITYDNLRELKELNPDTVLFADTTYDRLFNTAVKFNYHRFVDMGKGTSSFSAGGYDKLLEFCKDHSEKDTEDTGHISGNAGYSSVNSNVVLTESNIYSVYDAWLNGYRLFGEESVILGFPSESTDLSVVTAVSSFAISSDSIYKDASWEFIKSMLSEENQLGKEERMYASESLPVLREALEKQIETIKNKPYYIDEEGKRVEYANSILLGTDVVTLEPASKETAEAWMKFISSVKTRSGDCYVEEIKLITSIAEQYFNGTYLAEDIALKTQSYMSERVQYIDNE